MGVTRRVARVCRRQLRLVKFAVVHQSASARHAPEAEVCCPRLPCYYRYVCRVSWVRGSSTVERGETSSFGGCEDPVSRARLHTTGLVSTSARRTSTEASTTDSRSIPTNVYCRINRRIVRAGLANFCPEFQNCDSE